MRALAGLLILSTSAAAQGVRITWVGQACFYVETIGGGQVVVTDPPAASVGYALPTRDAHVVTVSHNHTDHNNAAGVRGSPAMADGRPVTERQQTTLNGMPFVLIPGFHDNTNGSARGRNTIVQWTQGGLRFAHFGDFGQDSLTPAQLTDLANIDIAFVPAGGFFTSDPARIAEMIRQMQPRVAVLMHYRTALGGPNQLATFPQVIDPFPGIRFVGSVVEVNPTALPAPTEFWMMEVDAETVATNAAGWTRGMPVAGGSLVSLWGNFTGAGTETASSIPLPRSMGNTEVLIGGRAAPLWFVRSDQINVQIPTGMEGSFQPYEVRVGGTRVARGTMTIVARAPGLFLAFNQNGTANSEGSPARRAEVLQIFATGQGPVEPAIADGEGGRLDPLSRTPEPPVVWIGGRQASVEFSGLSPGTPGLWQINALIPDDAPLGSSVSLLVVLGLSSNELRVAIQ